MVSADIKLDVEETLVVYDILSVKVIPVRRGIYDIILAIRRALP